jgi:hypothetical protein
MYGFSGYGTNPYGSERQYSTVVTQIIKLGARVFQYTFNQALTFMLYGSTRTFSDPSQSQTMKLPT